MIEWLQKKINYLGAFSSLFYRVISVLCLLAGGFVLLSLTACKGQSIGMLNPAGIIAYEERKLFFDSLALMLIVVLPVIIMSIAFAYHYQVSHRVKDYKPNWSHSYFLETIWWSIPCVIIVILAVLTWKKTHELDPYHKIPGHNEAPLLVQVIALPWKWLFIYPQQNIATVNYLVIPVGQQVEYWITADNVPMSAFFVPQLGSQIFAMAGMRTRLHLLANQAGVYDGMNTQFNGEGFSDMHFAVHAVAPEALQQWFATIKKSAKPLTQAAYSQLLNQSIADPPQFFAGIQANLFESVTTTYMNTFGTAHPRDSQLKLTNAVK